MSIGTYSELQTAVASWMHRADLTDRIPEFIALCEARANGHSKSRLMEARTTLTATSGNAYVTLPSDMLEMRRLVVTSSSPLSTLKYVSPDEITFSYPTTQQGVPAVFAVIGSQVQLAPIPDSSYTLEVSYLQKIPALSEANPTNWLLTNFPDVYLYGTLLQAVTYTQDFGQLNTLQTLYRDAVENMNAIDWYSGSLMAVRAR